MPKFDAVHISPNGKEGKEKVESGLYLWPHHPKENGRHVSDITPLRRYQIRTDYNVRPLGIHEFEDISDLRQTLKHGCRFAAPERRVVNPPETSRLDIQVCDRDSCLNLRVPNEKAVCSVSPVSVQEAREIIFSVVATNSEKQPL